MANQRERERKKEAEEREQEREKEREGPSVKKAARKKGPTSITVDLAELQEMDPEQAMMKLMGIQGFTTTKGAQVADNATSAAKVDSILPC